MIFIHGWSCDRSFFGPQVEHFEQLHRVVSVDLRGHGESDKPDGMHTVETYTKDVAHLMEHLGLGKAVAVGHSMGALIALQLAAAHPEQIAAIMMVDAAPFAAPPELRALFQQVAGSIEASEDSLRQQVIADLFLPSSSSELVQRVLKIMMATPRNVAASAMHAILDFDAPAAAARCKVPSLHIAAARPLNPRSRKATASETVNTATTPGTLSYLFEVRDHGKPLRVAYVGGTAIPFNANAAYYDGYIASSEKMAKAAAAYGATALLSNHSEFDDAFFKAHAAASRQPGEANPFDVGADGVARYFRVVHYCTEAAKLRAAGR
jgi:pimeloyl-ACP methyl ester carboxylesterase